MAASMGVTPDQLQQVAQMMASGMMPPGMEFGEDDGEDGEDGEGGGAVPPGATVVRLTDAEMAAVERVRLAVVTRIVMLLQGRADAFTVAECS